MRSHVFLTPMSPDGKPGEVKEIQFNDEGPRQFLEPVNPYLLNDAELGKLRSAVSDAETALRHAKSKNAGAAEITRLDKALTTAKRDLDTVEYELRRKRQREQTGAPGPFARQTLAEQVASVVAAVAALPTHKVKNTLTGWDKYLADFDATMAAKLATHNKAVCCEGRYLCAKCQAKKAAAA